MSYTSLKLWHRRNTTCSSCFKKKARKVLVHKLKRTLRKFYSLALPEGGKFSIQIKCEPQLPLHLNSKSKLFLLFDQALKISEKKHNIFMTFFSIFGNWIQIFFWQSTDFVEQTHLCSTPWPSALCWVGGDRSSHSPMATGQPPGPSGRSAHPWTRSSPTPHIIPWIQAAQALGRSKRGCKGCGLLCEVFLS